MREISFKGKTGSDWTSTFVGDPGWAAFWETVDQQTVAEGIGLKDSSGAEIYEGDIVEYRTHQGVVRYAGGFYEIHWTIHGTDRSTLNRHFESWDTATDLTVIGSVRESPDHPAADPSGH